VPSLEKEQLLSYFHETYQDLVRRNREGPNRDEEQPAARWDQAFPGRALGCFYLQTLGITPAEAALADVDGGNDEGIDSFHYDSSNHRLVLLQAKGGGDGPGNQPTLAETNRFIIGIRSFLSGYHTHFTELSADQRQLATEACSDPELQISAVFAHYGGELSEHTKREFEGLTTEINANYPNERLKVINFDRDEAHKAFLKIKRDQPVSCRLRLESHARHDGELRCFYGLALASDLKKLHLANQENPALYAQNVRAFYGDNAVNLKVKETLENEPNLLFYLNNGVTAICRSIAPLPATPADGSKEFQIEDLSIVNGAQTIGTIVNNLADEGTPAHVFVKIIEVSDSDQELSDKIARATNLQTSVDNLDFLSTHPRHQQLADTLKQSGITYQFKRSAEYGTDRLAPDKFTVQEAIEARICAGGDAKLLRNLRVQPSKLHEDFRNDMDLVFPANLSARTLWRQIQISRLAQEVIENTRDSYPENFNKAFFTHGLFFLKHLILKKSRLLEQTESMDISSEEIAQIRALEDPVILEAFSIAQNSFSAGHTNWNYVFKVIRNVSDLLRITEHLAH
jgi:hypothetical protein